MTDQNDSDLSRASSMLSESPDDEDNNNDGETRRATQPESSPSLRVRPVPKKGIIGRFVMCQGWRCPGDSCTFAHNKDELRVWNADLTAARSRGRSARNRKKNYREEQSLLPRDHSPAPASPSSTKWLTFSLRVEQNLVLEDIEEELTPLNYREKLHKLLCWEEKKRTDILISRCDGEYTLVLHKDGKIPQLLHRGIREYHAHFGFLEGVPGDAISNAVQASERAFVTVMGKCSVPADVLPENYRHAHNRLYLAFDQDSGRKLIRAAGDSKSIQVRVEFALTHRSFDWLHRAVDALPESVARRLMPSRDDFSAEPLKRLSTLPSHYDQLRMDDGTVGEQSQALKAALVYPSPDPPVLVLGHFGTGKTRVLAAVAYHALREAAASDRPARVLLCTHRVSADLFVEHYFGIMKNDPDHPWGETVVRLVPQFRKDAGAGSYPLLYRTVTECAKMLRHRERSKRIVVVVEYSICSEVWKVVPRAARGGPGPASPEGYFTHVLLDEAAQVTEPEALCPLSMATASTKIVLAGDTCLVKPVVLSEEAEANGLGISLLERLYGQYRGMGPQAIHHWTLLQTGYRCHDDITGLCSWLFYDTQLQSCPIPIPVHPLAPYPLIFVCTSLDPTPRRVDEDTDEEEASAVVEQVARFMGTWPDGWSERDMSTICIATCSRRQITVIKRRTEKHKNLNKVKIMTTYGLLGQEYRALFICASEPVWANGTSCNPAKSICNPYVFNTALTRAQSLVVTCGNPFKLMRTELSYELRCWGEYLRCSLAHNTIITTPQLEREWESHGKNLLIQHLKDNSA